MSAQDPQATWSEYLARKKSDRLAEAQAMRQHMQGAGVGAESVLAMDFLHFGPGQEQAQALAAQLREHYTVKVSADARPGYWLVEGTTRPYGVTLEGSQLVDWADFMADVAQSHGCVFSSWTVEAPALGARFRSEDFRD